MEWRGLSAIGLAHENARIAGEAGGMADTVTPLQLAKPVAMVEPD
jgi:hypothetical protein